MQSTTRAPLGLRAARRRVKPAPPDVDLGGLKADLERDVAGEVRFDAGSRALYANDFSLYRHVPIAVVIPRDADDVEAAVAACRRRRAPILPRGCGTGPSGQTVNVAVILDFSKAMNRILELDPDSRRARVQPGVICDQLRDAAEEHGLTYGPDPATREYCTFGGMLGNNSCGTHSLMAGKTSDNTEELDIVLYDGTRLRVGSTSEDELEEIVRGGGRRGDIYARLRDLRDRYADLIRERFPDIPRRVSGYNLDQLLPENGFHVARALVGTEGTCGTIVESTMRLVPSPPERITVLLAYPDVASAGGHVPAILEHEPIGLEGFDAVLTDNMEAKGRLTAEREAIPDGSAWLLAEFGAWSREEAEERANRAAEALRDEPAHHVQVLSPQDSQAAWTIRSAAVGDSRTPGGFESEGNWEDAAVHPDVLGDYLRAFGQLVDEHGYRCIYYGHFSQGCVHTRLDFDLKTAEGVRRFRTFMEEATDLVVAHGGSIAGEYGEGQGRAELLPRMFGPELVQAFREFKAIWDPDRKMNPGKVVDAYRLDEDLRLGPDHRPPQLKTHFAFPGDGGSFAAATERCFGMAKCRNLGDGTVMCPSFQVTREERHTTRGRARLLFEMLKGEVVTDGWRDEAVKESLDLCLACKGCKADCPVQVDMATYKAEFLSHYYARRLRPRTAYAMSLVPWWLRAAARAPALANRLAATGRTRPRGRAVARHVQRLLAAGGGPRGGGGHRGDGPPGEGPAARLLLRAPPLRARHAVAGQAAPAACTGRPGGRHRRRHPRRGARAELRGRVPRRASRHAAPRRARDPPVGPGAPAERVPGAPRRRLESAESTPARRRAPALSPPVGPGIRGRAAGDRAARPGGGGGRVGLLRDGRLVRLRRAQLRALDGLRRADAAAARPGAGSRRAPPGRRLQLPGADRPRDGEARAASGRGAAHDPRAGERWRPGRSHGRLTGVRRG